MGEIIGKPLKGRLVPICIGADVFKRLRKMALGSDVAGLLKGAVDRLLAEKSLNTVLA